MWSHPRVNKKNKMERNGNVAQDVIALLRYLLEFYLSRYFKTDVEAVGNMKKKMKNGSFPKQAKGSQSISFAEWVDLITGPVFLL